MNKLTAPHTLSNGLEIPLIGFGTAQAAEGEVAVRAVREAIAQGYRLIDTASIYGNEISVGRAIRESGVPREELFVTTKLWNDDHGYESTLRAFEASLRRLGLDYLDLYLIHWPNPAKFRAEGYEQRNADSWRAMEELYAAGKIRAIGVSNFQPRHLAALLKTATVKPMVNQIRLHPGYLQAAAVADAEARGILLEAYSPLGMGQLMSAPKLKSLADKYGRTVAQICLRWSLQKGFLPLPKSVTAARIKENAALFDFEIAPDDMDYLTGIENPAGPGLDPDQAPF
jgi:diketogulonate reductase-like aldo/keto reductase